MNFRLIFGICCFVSLILGFTPNFIQCTKNSPVTSDEQEIILGETSPMDVDPSCLSEHDVATEQIEQVVSSLTGYEGSAEEFVEVNFPVNNAQELEFGIQTLIQLSKNRLPKAQQQCRSLAINLIRGIEKIYGLNVVNVRDAIQRTRDRIIQQHRDRVSLELSQAFDSYLDKYNEKIRRFAIRSSCAPCLVMALFSFIFYILMIQEHHL